MLTLNWGNNAPAFLRSGNTEKNTTTNYVDILQYIHVDSTLMYIF